MSELTYRAADAKAQAGAYTAALVAALDAREPLDVLRATAAALRTGIDGMTPEQRATPEAPGKWSVLQLLQHLADSEVVGAYRFRLVLSQERPPLIGYDQDHWTSRLHVGDTDAEEVLSRFTLLRASTLRVLESLSTAELQRVGLHEERGEESIARMMDLYAGHDVVHLKQLARIRAAVVGPA
ncbi:MAG: DUF664 domain-containing protein [Candidatus Eisenbacteria bacterium]|uniref:DUF664 domain-containing protein n=1 Tax=Eiseniibacteriota bacterium TaxID=2212470 RepID=A0A849SGQ0_UNCEI|nr:DUF664 domain-containing protein [Candidatus Eisenbacteria bacterium]